MDLYSSSIVTSSDNKYFLVAQRHHSRSTAGLRFLREYVSGLAELQMFVSRSLVAYHMRLSSLHCDAFAGEQISSDTARVEDY
ncbi:hypothetical protein EVAR_38719_1 [Eumeta japonica]|uniref:Uncharacterized protein n=1 Tax=Eumeta variegata TaxID=151549 RepID=A0A4C1YL40_EUMVA|nr:hypothetical protein EVAR_38719_1 [Eumeta japonica]